MKKILLMLAAATLAFAACEKPNNDDPTPGVEVCPDCGKNPCECASETELFVNIPVKLQHEVTTNYGGTVVSLPKDKILKFFDMTEEEFYLAMGSLDDNKAQQNNTLMFGFCYKEDGEWVYDFTPATTNNFGHWFDKNCMPTVWHAEEAPSYYFTESRAWWGYESIEAAVAEGMKATIWEFIFGIDPCFYDGQVGDKATITEFIFDGETQKTCYITWDVEIVDFIDTEADSYKGAPSSKETDIALTVGTPVALGIMQDAFQLSKYQFNKALAAGQIATTNFIDGEQVDPSAGGFGGVWFDAEGKRTVWGAGDDVNAPACYYIELISSATDLSAYSNYFGEDSAAQVAGKTFNNFKQVVTYTPAEGESYTCTLNYTVTF